MPPPTLSDLTLGVFGEDPFDALEIELTPSTHPHPIARVRQWIVDRLKAAAEQPDRIVSSRATPTALSSLPVVLVYTLTEDEAEQVATGPDELKTPAEIAVHCVIAEADLGGLAIDDVLDAFDHVCKVVLLNDRQPLGSPSRAGVFGDQAHSCALGSRRIEHNDDGDRLVIHGQRTFTVVYSEDLGVPVDDALEVVHVDYDIPPTGDALDTADDIPQQS